MSAPDEPGETRRSPRGAIPDHPDVLVVGLGPAGARAAAAAASCGCTVLAIDRRQVIGEPVQCAEFVSAALAIEGLSWEDVTTQPILRMVTQVQGESLRVTEDFRGRMICRGAFDRALVHQARAAGAHILLGTAVSEVSADGSVRLSGGQRIRPRALIGADGPRSLVGAAIGQSNRELVAAHQVTVRLAQPHDATDIFLRAAYTGGYGWLFPKGNVANVGIGIDFRCRERLKPMLRELHAQLAAAGRVSPDAQHMTGGLIPVGGRLRAIGHLGAVCVALAGDAAGLTNPVTGAGIEAAVHSGALAGGAVASQLGGSPCALEEYESELSDLYDGAQARAMRSRDAVRAASDDGRVPPEALWRGWIASPEYWSNDRAGEGHPRAVGAR